MVIFPEKLRAINRVGYTEQFCNYSIYNLNNILINVLKSQDSPSKKSS